MKWTLKSIALVTLLAVLPVLDAERRNQQVVITAGTPIRISASKYLVNRLFIQSLAGNTGIVYVMLGVPISETCNASNALHLTAQLAAGTATAPGQSFSDPQGANGDSPSDIEDLALACLDGSHSGDSVVVSGWHRN